MWRGRMGRVGHVGLISVDEVLVMSWHCGVLCWDDGMDHVETTVWSCCSDVKCSNRGSSHGAGEVECIVKCTATPWTHQPSAQTTRRTLRADCT